MLIASRAVGSELSACSMRHSSSTTGRTFQIADWGVLVFVDIEPRHTQENVSKSDEVAAACAESDELFLEIDDLASAMASFFTQLRSSLGIWGGTSCAPLTGTESGFVRCARLPVDLDHGLAEWEADALFARALEKTQEVREMSEPPFPPGHARARTHARTLTHPPTHHPLTHALYAIEVP